jgi:hypothetical protein
MADPKLGHVFGVSKQRVLSYLERDAVDGLFKKALASDRHIVVYGSSKQGKTSLVDKNLPYSSNVVVICTPKYLSIDIYKAILPSETRYAKKCNEIRCGTAESLSREKSPPPDKLGKLIANSRKMYGQCSALVAGGSSVLATLTPHRHI